MSVFSLVRHLNQPLSGLCTVCTVHVCVLPLSYCELCEECAAMCVLIGSSTWFYQVLSIYKNGLTYPDFRV